MAEKLERIDTGTGVRPARRDARGRFSSNRADARPSAAVDQRKKATGAALPVAEAPWSRASVDLFEPSDLAFVETVPSRVLRALRGFQIPRRLRDLTVRRPGRRRRHLDSVQFRQLRAGGSRHRSLDLRTRRQRHAM